MTVVITSHEKLVGDASIKWQITYNNVAYVSVMLPR